MGGTGVTYRNPTTDRQHARRLYAPTMMRVALVSTEQFEVAVERDQPASVSQMSQLAEMGTKKNEQPREWWFVKCILDHQPSIPLAYEGRSRFHTSSALNIAELTRPFSTGQEPAS
jgi:hypothetical protein